LSLFLVLRPSKAAHMEKEGGRLFLFSSDPWKFSGNASFIRGEGGGHPVLFFLFFFSLFLWVASLHSGSILWSQKERGIHVSFSPLPHGPPNYRFFKKNGEKNNVVPPFPPLTLNPLYCFYFLLYRDEKETLISFFFFPWVAPGVFPSRGGHVQQSRRRR